MTKHKEERTFVNSDVLTAEMIAEHQGISRRRVYELFQLSHKHGGIPNYDIGNSKRVLKVDYLQWIEDSKRRKSEE